MSFRMFDVSVPLKLKATTLHLPPVSSDTITHICTTLKSAEIFHHYAIQFPTQ